MAPALRMTRSIKEKLPVFFIPYRSFVEVGDEVEVYEVLVRIPSRSFFLAAFANEHFTIYIRRP